MTGGTTHEPRYRLEHRIATGGMGEVWAATDATLGRQVAVKVLKDEYADDPAFRTRFQAEARNAAALHHPNVATVFDFGELPGDDGSPRPFLVMELVEGQPLSALLRGGEPMPPDTAVDLLSQAADGIAAAHRLGIVHRDVKPANLLVTPQRQVKITDFGIARAADAVALTQTGQVVGTPQYFSPEQAEGKPATPASDTYSLGVVLYQCLAGHLPFERGSGIGTALAHVRDEPPPLPGDVPAHLREVVSRSLAKDPADRFATGADFAAALRGGPVAGPAAATLAAPLAAGGTDRTRVLDEPVPATVAGAGAARSTTVAARPRRRLPGWLPWAAAAAVVALLLLLVALLAQRSDDTPERSPAGTTTTSSPRAPTSSATPSPSADDRVRVSAADYVGRPKGEAEDALRRLGLQLREQRVDNPGDQPKDTVAGVSPVGLLQPGSTVTVSVYDAPAPVEPPAPGDGKGHDGPGHGKGKPKEKKH
jgi:serine/threonine-protein kinase